MLRPMLPLCAASEKKMKTVVLDTNVFVAAGFNRYSNSARILRALRAREITLVWNQAVLRETRKILQQIPPISWEHYEDLFTSETEFRGEMNAGNGSGQAERGDYEQIVDPDDRKFAALAEASGAILVSNDEHLLSVRDQLQIDIRTPGDLVKEIKQAH